MRPAPDTTTPHGGAPTLDAMAERERYARAICRVFVEETARVMRIKVTEAWVSTRVDSRWSEYAAQADAVIKLSRLSGPAADAAGLVVPGVYIASKAIHGPRWRYLRAAGWPIISTWIDEAEAGRTTDWADLWDRCADEPARAAVTVLYREPGEELKGALVEVGAALSHGRKVIVVGPVEHTWANHRNVHHVGTLLEARQLSESWLAALSTQPAAAAGDPTPAVGGVALPGVEEIAGFVKAAINAQNPFYAHILNETKIAAALRARLADHQARPAAPEGVDGSGTGYVIHQGPDGIRVLSNHGDDVPDWTLALTDEIEDQETMMARVAEIRRDLSKGEAL